MDLPSPLNPYANLPPCRFWKTGVCDVSPFLVQDLYVKKFALSPEDKIANAGSCFSQYISSHLRLNGFSIIDMEPPPCGLPQQLHGKYGYSSFSARYGNLYTVKQLLQLALEAQGARDPQDMVWQKGDKFYDALRPAVEPDGLSSCEEVLAHRAFHISRVRELFRVLDVFIFTMGLTEAWTHTVSGTVYPTAPGVIAGDFDASKYILQNASVSDVLIDFAEFQRILLEIRQARPFKVILTVSPVPLTATATDKHVLQATSYSKSVLRAAAGEISASFDNVDYFPSFELINNPRLHSAAYESNLRSVRDFMVHQVMAHFFRQHEPFTVNQLAQTPPLSQGATVFNLSCEEALTETLLRN